jgi:hypothetical protein
VTQQEREPSRAREAAPTRTTVTVGEAANKLVADATGEALETGGGGPPEPPAVDASVLWVLFVRLRDGIASAGTRAAQARRGVILRLCLLVGLAAAAVVAGVVADNDVFWAASASAFTLATCSLVAYAAAKLGVFAETAELLGQRGRGGHAAVSGDSDGPIVESMAAEPTDLAALNKARGELASKIAKIAEEKRLSLEVFVVDVDKGTHDSLLVELEREVLAIGVDARHAPSARRLGQLMLESGKDEDRHQAENVLMDAVSWGDLTVAYALGCWHQQHPELVNDGDWWLNRARSGSDLAAYLAARARHDTNAFAVEGLPWPTSI